MSKFSRVVFGILFTLSAGLTCYGQALRTTTPVRGTNPNNRPARNSNAVKKLELVKENFISRQLKLTAAQASKFMPVYRRYQQELTAVKILKRINNSNATANGTQQIDNELAYDTQLVQIRKHYRDEFLKILPPEKVSEIYKSEREFNDEVLRQLKERSVRAGD
ncbi:hypothetical protein BH09BAC6_BH09BAC6_31440 [soil metagenome]|jgi:hypothetical protein